MREVTVIAAPDALTRATHCVRLAGGVVGDALDWDAVARWINDAPLARVALVEAEGVDAATLTAVLPRLDRWAREAAVSVVVAMTLDQVYPVTALTSGPRVDWLCEAGQGERVAALVLASVDRPGGLHDPARDPEHAARLARLADEVARIAEALSGLASEEARGTVGERRRGWGAAPAEPIAVSAGEVRAAIRARRFRDGLFGAGWFEDPAWDMLLDLFAAEMEGADVSVSSLCIAAAVAPTTALRWIARMEEAALIERRPDPRDRRRMFTGLSTDARALMRRYWAAATG